MLRMNSDHAGTSSLFEIFNHSMSTGGTTSPHCNHANTSLKKTHIETSKIRRCEGTGLEEARAGFLPVSVSVVFWSLANTAENMLDESRATSISGSLRRSRWADVEIASKSWAGEENVQRSKRKYLSRLKLEKKATP